MSAALSPAAAVPLSPVPPLPTDKIIELSRHLRGVIENFPKGFPLQPQYRLAALEGYSKQIEELTPPAWHSKVQWMHLKCLLGDLAFRIDPENPNDPCGNTSALAQRVAQEILAKP